jgi:AraC-like DNA-binding protein
MKVIPTPERMKGKERKIKDGNNQPHLLIGNMVCQRCIMTVESILKKLDLPFIKVKLGEVELEEPPEQDQLQVLSDELTSVGFELIETRVNRIVEDIRKLVLNYLALRADDQKLKLSSFITSGLHYDYSYLSDLFSSIEGTTIEQYFLLQRIEKVKELLVYDQLTLTEISYRTGFSSVHHLSAQFKKITGLTPSHFRKIGEKKRKAIDLI